MSPNVNGLPTLNLLKVSCFAPKLQKCFRKMPFEDLPPLQPPHTHSIHPPPHRCKTLWMVYTTSPPGAAEMAITRREARASLSPSSPPCNSRCRRARGAGTERRVRPPPATANRMRPLRATAAAAAGWSTTAQERTAPRAPPPTPSQQRRCISRRRVGRARARAIAAGSRARPTPPFAPAR